MKALNYGLNLNNAEVAELIRTTRIELYTANPSNRRQYTIRGAAKAIGISPTYYEKLENNKNAVVILKPIYTICKHLQYFAQQNLHSVKQFLSIFFCIKVSFSIST